MSPGQRTVRAIIAAALSGALTGWLCSSISDPVAFWLIMLFLPAAAAFLIGYFGRAGVLMFVGPVFLDGALLATIAAFADLSRDTGAFAAVGIPAACVHGLIIGAGYVVAMGTPRGQPASCAVCGYSQIGITSGRCPECGSAYADYCGRCGQRVSSSVHTHCPECGLKLP